RGLASSIVTNYYDIVVPLDSDNDNLPDGWEFTWFGSSYTLVSENQDNDQDRCNNWCEFVAGTIPTETAGSATSFPKVTTISPTTTQMSILIPTEDGRRYIIEYSDNYHSNPGDPTWNEFVTGGTYDDSGAGTSHTFVDTLDAATTGGSPADGYRAYRIRVEKP
ncbi:MAG: hypothetical protein KJ626_03895, partial [Verrucomicrobia bacterium]|nr:hypothetical protein [Verrucomicrobiota bacterium]